MRGGRLCSRVLPKYRDYLIWFQYRYIILNDGVLQQQGFDAHGYLFRQGGRNESRMERTGRGCSR